MSTKTLHQTRKERDEYKNFTPNKKKGKLRWETKH